MLKLAPQFRQTEVCRTSSVLLESHQAFRHLRFREMNKFIRTSISAIVQLIAISACVAGFAGFAAAQSTDGDAPTPVWSSDISGRIAARDLGDSRLTRHYYLFIANPGDLIVTVESSNLNGDVDVFTAGTLRPLGKLSIFAIGEITGRASKTVFLRKRETLVLRVEARSGNDEEGRYRVLFSGGFEAIAGAEPPGGSDEQTAAVPRSRNTSRVNAAGARLAEAPPEIAASTPSDVAPIPTELEEKKVEEPVSEPSVTTATTATPEAPKPKPRRTTRARRPARPKPQPAEPPSASAQPATSDTLPADASAETTTPPKRGASRSSRRKAAPPPTTAEAAAMPSARLIIETRDGEVIERSMIEVKSVTIYKGQLVVITTDGKAVRRSMTNILRMIIQP